MIVHNDYQQQSVEWMLARSGIPTASEFDQLITPEFKSRTGLMPATYLAKKVAEIWLGGPLLGFNVFDMDQGKILEEEAKPWFSLEFGQPIQSVGFITTDNERVGCSPDGLLGDDCGIEIKCPAAHTHVSYLLKNELPKDYAAQVHGSMFVTGFSTWKFLSYRRHFPPMLLTVNRDEEIQQKIRQAVTEFLVQLDEAVKRMTELNGGPPRRRSMEEMRKTATRINQDPAEVSTSDIPT